MEHRFVATYPYHYLSAYKVYLGVCDEGSPSKVKWRESILSEVVVPKLQAPQPNELRVLGVGTASGEKECGVLEKLSSPFQRINYRVVEPEEEYITQFKKLAESRSHQLHGVSFDWRQQTLEQYQTTGDATKFHFISASHVMYHVKDWEGALLDLYSQLEPGGRMRVDITAGNGGLIQFWNRFASLWHGCNYISSTEILRSLDQHGIPYDLHRQPGTINITKCFDETSEEGGLLLDFLCQGKFTETAPKELKKEVLHYLATCENTERIGGDVVLNNGFDMIIISKSLE